jgi:hypothetical protein
VTLASKHLAVVSRRLAAVATIFLPISFLAGGTKPTQADYSHLLCFSSQNVQA